MPASTLTTLSAAGGILAGVALVELHAPNGHVIEINPAEVSSLREPIDVRTSGHWAGNTHCVLVMTNSGFNAIQEDCATAAQKLKQ
jgi:hypothetical protein